MQDARQAISFLVALSLLGAPVITGAEEPVGLTLRKGTIVWESTLQQARSFIEENMRPDTPTDNARALLERLAGQHKTDEDDNKFSCKKRVFQVFSVATLHVVLISAKNKRFASPRCIFMEINSTITP